MLTNEDYTLMIHLCLRSLRSYDLNKKQVLDIENLLHKLITIKNIGDNNAVVGNKKVGKRARVRST
jgi:hypothetical protein